MSNVTVAALLLVIAVPQASPPQPSQGQAGAAASVREGYVDAPGGVRLFYRLVGTASDIIVVIHGGPGFSMEYFADDLRFAALDANAFAEDLKQFVVISSSNS